MTVVTVVTVVIGEDAATAVKYELTGCIFSRFKMSTDTILL